MNDIIFTGRQSELMTAPGGAVINAVKCLSKMSCCFVPGNENSQFI